ncbi:MAG: hypothetical protein AMJ81_04450 [Phycisphaerae bacterium SM23_33]|nr:MAG: hypothetical protein AMJ81_04450 [Phycisphaerae bacterium SM23_33]
MALLLLPFTLALWQGNTQAQQPGSAEAPGGAAAEVTPRAHALFERQTLTDDWLGFGKHLASAGVKIQLDLTQVYQVNLRGGISTHRHSGRYAGSYDLGLALDLEKLLNVAGAAIFAKAKGSWSDGLDASCVGSAVGDVNDDASGDYSIYLARLYYQQSLLEGRPGSNAGTVPAPSTATPTPTTRPASSSTAPW